MGAPLVSDTTPDQLPAIARIYAAAVEDGPATFDLAAPPLAWWRSVLEAVDATAGHLMLTASDDDGAVLGYAKSGSFRPKAAYDSTCETSIYVAGHARGRGVGNALYEELLARLDRSGLRLAVAGATVPNPASVRLHRAHGFTEVGTFAGVGVKFDRPWDVVWYQRPLGGAALLDRLRDVVAAAGERADVAARAATALLDADGHGRVAIYELRDDALEPIAVAGQPQTAPTPYGSSLGAAELASGRALVSSADGRSRATVPVLEPARGRVLGTLEVERPVWARSTVSTRVASPAAPRRAARCRGCRTRSRRPAATGYARRRRRQQPLGVGAGARACGRRDRRRSARGP